MKVKGFEKLKTLLPIENSTSISLILNNLKSFILPTLVGLIPIERSLSI